MKKSINIVLTLVVLLFTLSGCGKKEDNVIKIGAILPLTGDNAVYGIEIKNGIEICLGEINKKNGISGRKIVVIYEDDQGDPANSISAYKKLTQINKVRLILGGVFSSSTLAIAPLAEKEHVVLLSPTSSAIEITNAGDYTFRIYPSDAYDGAFLAEYSYNKLSVKTAAVLFLQVTSTTQIAELYKKRFEELGGKIVLMEGHKEGDTDFKTSLIKVKELNPNIVFLPSYLREMAILLKQTKELDIHAKFLSVSSFYDPKILELAGNACEGVIFSSPYYDPNRSDPFIKQFVTSFETTYGHKPNIWAGYGYDVVRVAAEALKSGTSSNFIKEGLYKIKDYPGVTGNVTFDQNGDVIKPLKIFTVRNGKFEKYDR